MRTPLSDSYLLVPDVQALRAKIARADGTVAYLWKSLQALPQAEGNGRYYPAFLHLVTGRDDYALTALAEIKAAMEVYRAGDLSIDVHFHTWCNSAPLARLAVMLDWIADSPVVTAADFAEIKEALLDYTLKHPYNIAKSRTLAFDNQISAMSFCCALVGYLFGVKRGSDLRAQRLMEAGIMRFPDIFALSPPGGYSGEGSTYFCQIVAPVVSWYCALMEQITGEELFSRPFPPSRLTPEEVLRTYQKILGPAGLMPPWDHYGWMRCASLMGLAYLARKTGDPAPLAAIERLGLGAEPGHIAWGSDDKLWTLIWWPEQADTAGVAEPFPSWAIANVGGALTEPRQAWRLFQAWDACAPSVYCGRAQVNPNMIALECWGSPIFTDGTPTKQGCPLFDYPLEAFRSVMAEGELDSITSYYRTFVPNWDPKDWVKGFGYGLIGGSNSIVVNNEGQYSPASPREGRLHAFADLPGLKLLAGEVADYYRPHYPIASMVRTSVLVGDGYYLVRDTIRTDGPSLRFDWQVFARGEVTAEGNRVRIVTTEGVQVDVLPLKPEARLSLTPAPGYPMGLEGASTRIRYRVDGAAVDLPFLLVPRRPFTAVADLRDGWSAVRQSEVEGIAAGLPHGVDAAQRVPANEIGLIPGDGHDGWIWASRPFTVPAANKGQRISLHVASRVHALRVWVNGREALLPDRALHTETPGGWYVPAVVELTGLLQSGANTLTLAGPTSQGKLVNGAVELLAAKALPPLPEVTVQAPGHYLIRGLRGQDELILSDRDGRIVTPTLTAEAQAVLLHADGRFAALQCTRLAWGAVQCWSDRPVDLAWEAGELALSDLSGPETVEVAHPDFHLSLQSRGALAVDLSGCARPRLTARLDAAKPVFVNGQRVEVARDPYTGRLAIAPPAADAPPSDPAMPAYVQRLEALMRAAASGEPTALPLLLAGLADCDWKVQQVAAELLGCLGDSAAVAPLLALLERESADVIYRDELLWWADARQQCAADDAPWRAGAGSSADAVKRHRLKAVVIEALGRLRARDAVTALCRIVEDQREFYPVHSLACQALGRIGDPAALPSLEKASHYAEVNTKLRARDAVARIAGGHPVHPEYPDRS